MTESRKGYYSIIQYCPDLSRLEGMNVGVLLFCPEPRYLGVKMTGQTNRLKNLVGKERYKKGTGIRAELQAFEDRIGLDGGAFEKLADLERFVQTRGNSVQMTAPRFVSIKDPAADLHALFARLVDATPAVPEADDPAPIVQLEHALDEAEDLAPLVRRNVSVAVPALRRSLHAPFGFLNGRFNLLLADSFRRSNPTEAENRACRHAIEGRSVYENPDAQLGDLHLYVVADFPRSQRQENRIHQTVETVLAANHVRLITVEQIPKLVDEIRRTGRPLPQAN